VKDLEEHAILSIAAANGVYIPKTEQVEPYLVNASLNVTGRKQDDTDAIWLQKPHTCKFYRRVFKPTGVTEI